MPIKFYGSITWKREQPYPGGSSYRPNIRFNMPGMEAVRFGLTTMDEAEWPLNQGETKSAHFYMIGASEFERLAKEIREDVRFVLLEGSFEVASGVVNKIEARTLDEPTEK